MSKKRICLLLATVFFLTAACAALWPSARSVSAAAEGFTVVAGEVTQSENSYGTAFAGTGAFSLRSDRTAWADKFGVILRADAEDSEGLNVILSSEKDVWYTSAAHSVRILLEPIGEGSTAISLFADEALLGEYETVMFNWTADRSYSTNYLCLGKDGDQWIFNINDAVIETGADAALDEVLAGFPDKCGFLQLENLGGPATLTYIGIQYGIPTGETSSPYEGFSVGPVLSSPRWNTVTGEELAAWQSDFGSEYTLTGIRNVPLNGFEMSIRMAHGEGAGGVMLAMTSLYGGSNWYAGTYSLVFRVSWDPSYEEGAAQVQLLIYHPDTESLGEEPIKLSEMVSDFGWFSGCTFEVVRLRGEWTITLNDQPLFRNRTSSEGMDVNDYLNFISPYYENGLGCFQVWEPRGVDGTVQNTGYVLESLSTAESNEAPRMNVTALSGIIGQTYRVGESVSIDLNELFADEDGDALSFFATKGRIENGMWTYLPGAAELLFVTFTVSDGEASVTERIWLTVEESEAASGGCGGLAFGGLWTIALAGIAGGALCLLNKRKEEN